MDISTERLLERLRETQCFYVATEGGNRYAIEGPVVVDSDTETIRFRGFSEELADDPFDVTLKASAIIGVLGPPEEADNSQ